MADAPHEVTLRGCTPEPLMNYLKALGVLRLVAEDAEHGDPGVRGFWRDDVFVLRSRLDEKGLEEFFLHHYRPTPIVAPWAGGSGFFTKGKKSAVDELSGSSVARLVSYREVIQRVREIIHDEKTVDKPTGEDKIRLIQRYRRELPDDVLSWMDAAMVLQAEGQSFAPILGTGGNDGRLDFTQNFMQRIVLLRLHENEPADESRAWVRQSLLASAARLNAASVGQFAPGRAGGPNATQGMEGDSTDNPWDFVLMMEGSLVLSGAAVRRLGVDDSRAAFPFTVRGADVGFASAGPDESFQSRGELWMPLWDRPSSSSEVAALFGEGRAEVNGRPARDAVDFARAAATLGVDRGIATFSRVSILKRNGKAFLATPAGRFAVAVRPETDLLREVDHWLGSLRRACASKGVPPRFTAALRAIDAAIFDFCRYGGATHFEAILVALGGAERALANAERFREDKRLMPLAGLSAGWIDAARPLNGRGAREFEIALALAGIRAADGEQGKVGSLRANLEPVSVWYDKDKGRSRASWAERDRAVTWNAADLSTNLAAGLARRIMDGERTGCENLPLESRHGASPEAIAAFLRGELDELRIEDLLWGLMLVDAGREASTRPGEAAIDSPPLIYGLFKLLFLPRDLVVVIDGNSKPRWSLARHRENGTHPIRSEARILSLLRAERVTEAAEIAMRRLWVSGLALWCSHAHHDRGCQIMRRLWASGKMAKHLASPPGEGHRLAAGLLIPVHERHVGAIVRRATSLEEWSEAISYTDQRQEN